jgi:succinoglycan biosynthesis transport protein ExoP
MNQQREEQSAAPAVVVALRRRLWMIIACAVLVPAAALAFSFLQEKQYSTSASLLFRDPQFDQKIFGSTVFQPTSDPNREAATNVKLVSLNVVAARTAKALGTGISPGEVSGKVTVASAGQSDVANITATDHEPAFAAKLANTFATQFIAFRRDADRSKIASASRLVQQQLSGLPARELRGPQAVTLRKQAEQLRILGALQTGNAELVQPAEVPGAPSSPNPIRNAMIGLVFGILLGLGLAMLRERLDRRLKDPKDISDAFDRPVLGAIPESRQIAGGHQSIIELGAGEAESFRMLRANLRYFNVDRKVVSVLITSASPGEGKSTVAAYLAAAAASAGQNVLLLEADLRRPTLGARLGVPAGVGLSRVLSGDGTLRSAVQKVSVATRGGGGSAGTRSMDVCVAGPIPPNPADLIESDRMRQIIKRAEQHYDLVVIDTPPTSVVSDAIPLVKEVSGVIVVTRLGKTTRESAAGLRGQLENLDAHTLGVVVNSIGKTGAYGYGYGGYGYGYGPLTEPSAPATGNGRSRPASTNGVGEYGHVETDVAEQGALLTEIRTDDPAPSADPSSERFNGYEREPSYGEDYLPDDDLPAKGRRQRGRRGR